MSAHGSRNPLAIQVAAAVIQLRERRGMTRTALAEAAGVSRSTLWRIENGLTNPDLAAIRRLAVALDATIAIDILPRTVGGVK